MRGRTQTLPCLLGGEGVKTTEYKIHVLRFRQLSFKENFGMFGSLQLKALLVLM
jgi:hypothetical protein